MQASASVFGETEHDIAEESSIEDVNLNRVENTKMGLSTDGQPARKQKLVFIRKRNRQTVDNIKNDNTPGKDEDTEDAACSDKKRTRIVIDLNNPRVGPCSDDDNKSSFANSNKTDSLTPLANGQRQSRRNRSLTKKALEALEIEFMNPKKKRMGLAGMFMLKWIVYQVVVRVTWWMESLMVLPIWSLNLPNDMRLTLNRS
ncbi:hypothetical protein HanLR1_Chr01g0028581 [Helianthus annuus]|nr:hypothetical protein HanLR1_Chr01g0028581 [Helianthus annuus]